MNKCCPVADHAPSLLPKDKKWKMVWNDEFDLDHLDETKWMYRLNFWGQPHPGFGTKGVHCEDSCLHIDLVKDENDEFTSAHLQTGSLTFDEPKDSGGFWPFGQLRKPLFMHRYGYYEIRCKLPHGDGWHAAFWLQSPSVGTHPDPAQCGVECDIMENYRQKEFGEIVCGCGWNGYGKGSKGYGHVAFPVGEGTDDGWHYYGVDWTRDGYIFYADGKEVGRQMAPECAVSDVDEFILVSTECHGYVRNFATEAGYKGPGHAHPALYKAYPDSFIVDHVRVFDEIP